MISFIWAQSTNNVIGKDNKLPWNIKEEMQHFVEYTRGKTVLMGRNTWESLSVRPLPKRTNIVITNRFFEINNPNVIVSNNLDKYLNEFKDSNEELVIIGGTQIFNNSFDFANKLIVSCIKKEYNGDVYAPVIDKDVFKIISTNDFDEFTLKIYERNK